MINVSFFFPFLSFPPHSLSVFLKHCESCLKAGLIVLLQLKGDSCLPAWRVENFQAAQLTGLYYLIER